MLGFDVDAGVIFEDWVIYLTLFIVLFRDSFSQNGKIYVEAKYQAHFEAGEGPRLEGEAHGACAEGGCERRWVFLE